MVHIYTVVLWQCLKPDNLLDEFQTAEPVIYCMKGRTPHYSATFCIIQECKDHGEYKPLLKVVFVSLKAKETFLPWFRLKNYNSAPC